MVLEGKHGCFSAQKHSCAEYCLPAGTFTVLPGYCCAAVNCGQSLLCFFTFSNLHFLPLPFRLLVTICEVYMASQGVSLGVCPAQPTPVLRAGDVRCRAGEYEYMSNWLL